MHPKSPSCWGEGQAPLDLTGCSFAPIPDTDIQLCHPTGTVAKRLEKEFKIPSRIVGLLKAARKDIGGREIFLQDHHQIGHTPNGLVYVVITILATAQHWRGGWFLALVLPAEADVFKRHLESARAASVEELRTERRQHGSRN